MSAWRGLRILFTAQAWKIWDFHQLEQRVTEVAQFYSSSSKKQLGSFKGSSIVKDREKEKQITSSKKHLDPNRREAASTKRMQELMRQFSTILGQITQHKWAWPFMQPVDVEDLGLHDYYEEFAFGLAINLVCNKLHSVKVLWNRSVLSVRKRQRRRSIMFLARDILVSSSGHEL